MDPWLEHPARWPNVHQSLITYSRDALQSQVGDRYFVSIGERVFVEVSDPGHYPDVSIVEARTDAVAQPQEVFLEIFDGASGERVVTVIEILSPSNKRPGPGRDLYVRKQVEVLAATTNLVEIDLLRAGEPTVALPRQWHGESSYRVVVSKAVDRARRELYPISLRDRLPRVAIPLLEGDRPAVLDVQAVFNETYEKGGFGRRIDYGQPPIPPLGTEDHVWAEKVLAAPA